MKNSLLKSFFLVTNICLCSFFISSCNSDDEESEKLEKEISEKYKCDNVDDCISKYQFEGARAYMAEEEKNSGLGVYKNLPKITQAESIYLAKQNEFERAIDVINEANQINYYEQEKQKLKFIIYEMAVSKYCDDGDFTTAKKFALKSSDLINTEGWSKDGTNTWNDNETQQKILLKKIKDYETAMK